MTGSDHHSSREDGATSGGFYVLEDSNRPDGPTYVVGYVAAALADDGTFTSRDLGEGIGSEILTRAELLARADGMKILASWERGDHSALHESEWWGIALLYAADARMHAASPDDRLDYWRRQCVEAGLPTDVMQAVWDTEEFWAELNR